MRRVRFGKRLSSENRNMKASKLENGDLVQIEDELFHANNVSEIRNGKIHVEHIDDEGRHPYLLKPDEEVVVVKRSGSGVVGVVGPDEWWYASDKVIQFLCTCNRNRGCK